MSLHLLLISVLENTRKGCAKNESIHSQRGSLGPPTLCGCRICGMSDQHPEMVQEESATKAALLLETCMWFVSFHWLQLLNLHRCLLLCSFKLCSAPESPESPWHKHWAQSPEAGVRMGPLPTPFLSVLPGTGSISLHSHSKDGVTTISMFLHLVAFTVAEYVRLSHL